MTSITAEDPSPSHARRKALRDADKGRHVAVVNSFPIENYYDAADRLFEAFSAAQDERRLDDAYVLGIRFATFSIESLPQHGSYQQKPYNALRRRNAQKVEAALQKLESVTERMDAEEKAKQRRQRQQQQERLVREEETKQREAKQCQLLQEQEQFQRENEARKREEEEEARRRRLSMDQSKKTHLEIQQSALAKLEAMKQDMANEQANACAETTLAHNMEPTLPQHQKHSGEEAETLAYHQAAHRHEKPPPQHKPTGLRPEEERTIELLHDTIARQEQRIQDVQTVTIPDLLRTAKTKLNAGKRKEALYAVYRKKRWDRHVDDLKTGIFRMETQIVRLESAVEDREVAGVLRAANEALHAVQEDAARGKDIVDDVNHEIAELVTDTGVEADVMLDEEELLSELEGSSTSACRTEKHVSELPGSQDLLSLPSVPSTDMPKVKEPSLLKAVIS